MIYLGKVAVEKSFEAAPFLFKYNPKSFRWGILCEKVVPRKSLAINDEKV